MGRPLRGRGTLRLRRLSAAVLVVGLAATTGAFVLAWRSQATSEEHELHGEAGQIASLLGSMTREIEGVLGAAAAVADVSGGDPRSFEDAMSRRLAGGLVTSVTMLGIGPDGVEQLAQAGTRDSILLPGLGNADVARLREIAAGGKVALVKIAEVPGGRVVGFAVTGDDSGTRAVYGESFITEIEALSLFLTPPGVRWALYIGDAERPDNLIAEGADTLPIGEPRIEHQMTVGADTALLVIGSDGGLAGRFTHLVPWLVVAIGVAAAVGLALLVETTRRRADAEANALLLARQNEQLREVDRLKDDFVAMVSHELRTPLTSILGYLELLRDDAGEPMEDREEYLHVIGRNAHRLLSLVGDLLFVARVDAGGLQLEIDEVAVSTLARESVEAQRPRADAGDVTLRLSESDPGPVQGDRARLGQLLDNLVSNAIKFTPPGGWVELRVLSENGRVVIEVADTGMGIPADEQARLFEPFFRASTATAGAIQGTGLGLTIARAIVDAHGGSIGVESEEGAGTTFRVELPFGERVDAGESRGSEAVLV